MEKLSRCDYCVDPCNNPNPTKCISCEKTTTCHRNLHPTIRITRKCTQQCTHCCFSCSPNSTDMMSLTTAKEISKFLANNNINQIQIMGGEFFLNPNWEMIITELSKKIRAVRLVSNGDWFKNSKTTNSIISFLKNNPNIKLSLSFDKWHTNKYIEIIAIHLKENNILFDIANEKENDEKTIVPIGRADNLYINSYSMFSCFCDNPINKYGFLIDEKGDIFKCSFGVWKYTNVKNHLEGGFAKRFKEFNFKFYDIFIPNCSSCIRNYKKNN